MKVLLSCPVNSQTGYGTDGIELAQALMAWGADVYLHPSGIHPPISADVAALLTKPIPEHVDLLISHRCPQELSRSPESAGLYSHSTVSIAWSMWEWDSLDNVDEVNQSNCEHAFRVTDHLSKALTHFDAVFAYDEVSKQALSPYHDNVSVLQGGVKTLPPYRRDWSASPFRFLMLGALSNRKNPFVAIQAFKALRDAGELADAQLVLKTTFPGLHPAMESWCPGLKVIGEVWSVDAIHALYRESHVLLAPSWGEGKNRPAIEFASTGGAVIATNVGGHAQWMSNQYAYPLDFEMQKTSSGCEARGAIASQEHLQQLMLETYSNRAETARRGEVASRVLPGMVSWNRVLERFCDRLETVAGNRGVEVSTRMRMCRKPEKLESEQFQDFLKRGALDGLSS